MMRAGLWCGILMLLARPVLAQAPVPPLVRETWHAAYFEGAKAGHVHTTVQEVRSARGEKLFRTIRDLDLVIRRYGKVVPFRVQMTSDEYPDGKVAALSFTQFLDREGRLTLAGQVEDGKLLLSTSTMPGTRELPWTGKPMGLYYQDRVFQLRKVKPGQNFRFDTYELALQAILPVQVSVKPVEEVDLLELREEKGEQKVTRVTRKLLRAETRSEKIKLGENEIELPGQILWLDRAYQPVRYQQEFPGIGQFTLYQTTREIALKEGIAPALLPDLGLNSIIPLDRSIPQALEASHTAFRIKVLGDQNPATLFSRDLRQQVLPGKKDEVEVRIRAIREPLRAQKGEEPGKQYLESSHFIDWNTLPVRLLANRLTRGDADPLNKARKIEKWVHANMKPNSAVGYVSASQIASDLNGDCRQCAMLSTALCRAAGIPARTALGLVYVEEQPGKPTFMFHMWTEVWVQGQWFSLDGTLGRGSIGACHLKISDSSWSDTQTLAPVLPVARVLGKLKVQVLASK